MSEAVAARFSCDGCSRSYAWKDQLANRRVKCKCGHVMTVPAAPPEPEIDENALYDLAADEPAQAPVKLAPLAAPVKAVSSAKGGGAIGAGAVPPVGLGYQMGQTQREKERFSAKTLMDMKRDVYVPTAMLIVGLLLYTLRYVVEYRMSGAGFIVTMLGLSVLTVVKAIFLIAFAFLVAGPLGVSFGGIWTAILKLAAIAVSTDAITSWAGYGIQKLGGGASGGFFMGMGVTWVVAVACYWLFMIYLFSMDQEDSWTVVMILSVFDRIMFYAIIFGLFSLLMGGRGISAPTLGGGGAGGGGTGTGSTKVIDEDAVHVDELKDQKLLREAKEYIAGGRQDILKKTVDDWYAAGCKNVWFEVSRDFSAKISAVQVIVEMPTDPKKRTECIDIAKDYYKRAGMKFAADNLKDDGGTYMMIGISG